MPIPLIPVIGAAIAGGAIGVCISKVKYQGGGFLYDADGYNNFGFDRDGFDRAGYDSAGFDCDGFDRQGFDRTGFDREGYNANGLDRDGFDREGWDQDGYNLEGFDAAGRDRKGFDRAGWNAEGRDVTGHDAGYYRANAAAIRERVKKAEELIAAGDCEHASLEIRKGAELAVNCVISHTLGIGRYKRHLESDINACKGALDDQTIGKLQNLRQVCSDQLHVNMKAVDDLKIEAKYAENLQNRLRFCAKTLEEVLAVVEGYTVGR